MNYNTLQKKKVSMSSKLNIQVMNFLSCWCTVTTPFTLFEKNKNLLIKQMPNIQEVVCSSYIWNPTIQMRSFVYKRTSMIKLFIIIKKKNCF